MNMSMHYIYNKGGGKMAGQDFDFGSLPEKDSTAIVCLDLNEDLKRIDRRMTDAVERAAVMERYLREKNIAPEGSGSAFKSFFSNGGDVKQGISNMRECLEEINSFLGDGEKLDGRDLEAVREKYGVKS
jgi:hypothetical protein